MIETDLEKFHAIISVLSIAITDKEISPEREAIYLDALKRFPIQAIEYAAHQLRDTCKFFPTISEFIQVIEGTMADKAKAAWYRYIKALDLIGIDNTLDLGDPVAHMVITELRLWGNDIAELGYPDARRTGKTIRIQSADCDARQFYPADERMNQMDFIRMEFEKRYVFHATHPQPEFPRCLIGLRAHNQRQNMELYSANWPAPVLDAARKRLADDLTPVNLDRFLEQRKVLNTHNKNLPAVKS